jgi:DNA-binding LacI/PurR family transcriptional regulator
MVRESAAKKATIREVAKLAGVTPAIVSRVFNQDAALNIREETRNSVVNAIAKLQYKPNAVARSLRTRSINTIGVLISDIINPFYSQLIKGIQFAANESDYCIILCDTNDDPLKEKRYIETLKEQFVRGVILSSLYINDSVVELIEGMGMNYVMVNRGSTNSSAPYVKTNDIEGMMMAANHLIELNHTKIAFISGPLYAETAVRRLTGYRKSLKEAAIHFNPKYVIEAHFDEQSGYEACKRLLSLDDRPTAICVCNDLMAIGAMRAIKEAGLSVPNDISVVGYNNIWVTSVLATPLTTIDTPLFEMGRQSFQLLLGLINEDQEMNYKVTLPTKLIIRESTARLTP